MEKRDRRFSTWLELLELEHDNCRAGLESARELGERGLELRLASALGAFWEARSHFDEGRKRITEALAGDPDAPVSLRGEALRYSAWMAFRQGDYKTARGLAEEAAAGDETRDDMRAVAKSLHLLGAISVGERDFDQAKALYKQNVSIREKLGDEVGLYAHNLGLLALEQGDLTEARRQLEAGLAYAHEHELESQIANSVGDLGFIFLAQAQHEEASLAFEEALRGSSQLGLKELVAYDLIGLAAVSTEANDLELAAQLLGQVASLVDEIHVTVATYAETIRDQTRQELESRVDPARFASCFEEGRATPFEDVISLALSDVD